MSETGIKVTMRHVRQAAMCSRGTRAFFQRHHLDWDTFLREGLDSSLLRATGDAMAIRVAEIAEAEHGQ